MMKRFYLRAFSCIVAASLLLLLLFQSLPCALAQQQTTASVAPSDNDLVWLTVTVLNDKRKFLTGLRQSDFNLTDNKKPLDISAFSSEDAPQSIGIIFDLSTSVIETKLAWAAVEGVRDFLRDSHEANEYFLIGFDDKPQVVVDWTTESNTLMDRLRPGKDEKYRQTALNDSLYLATEKVKTGKFRKRVLIVISDGADTASTYRFREVSELLKESDVTVYAVAPVPDGSVSGADGPAVLAEWSSLTGGEMYVLGSKKQSPEIFKYLAEQLRHQYRIGFRPAPESGKPRWHQLKLSVKLPPGSGPEFKDLFIKSRKGYYPNAARR